MAILQYHIQNCFCNGSGVLPIIPSSMAAAQMEYVIFVKQMSFLINIV